MVKQWGFFLPDIAMSPAMRIRENFLSGRLTQANKIRLHGLGILWDGDVDPECPEGWVIGLLEQQNQEISAHQKTECKKISQRLERFLREDIRFLSIAAERLRDGDTLTLPNGHTWTKKSGGFARIR